MEDFNQKQRAWFIGYWADYIKTHSDKEWSRQQNILINSVLKSVHQMSRKEYLEQKRSFNK